MSEGIVGFLIGLGAGLWLYDMIVVAPLRRKLQLLQRLIKPRTPGAFLDRLKELQNNDRTID